LLSYCLLTLNLRGGGFRPRQFGRSALSSKIKAVNFMKYET